MHTTKKLQMIRLSLFLGLMITSFQGWGQVTPISTIREMVDDDYAPTDTDTVYVVEGVVTTPINLTSSSHGLFYMQDGESGIAVFHRGAGGEVPAQGDKVRVTAPIGAFNGLLQLNPNADTEGHAVEILSSGNDLPAAWPVDFAEVENPEVMEMRESGLAKVTGVTISGEGEFSNSGNFTLTDGEGRTFTLRVDSRSDFGGNAIPTGPVDISGVIGQFDNSAPFSSGYQLLAPQFSNIDDPNAIETTPIATIRGMVDDDYAPTDTDTVYVVEGVVTTPINLTSSSHGLFYMQDGESGIAVFHRGAGGEVPAQGDKVRVTAPIGAFNGLLQLNPNADTEGHAVEILSSGNDLPAAWPVDFAEVENPEVMEMRESGLAKVTGVTISGEGEFSNSGNFTLTDEEGRTFTLRVDSRSDFGGNAIPTGPVDISGVIGQFDNSAPFTSGYQILAPQFSNVVDPNAIETTPIATIRGMVDDDYAPTDTDTVYVVEGVVTTPINLTSSSHGLFYMQDGESGIAVFHRGAGGEVPAQGDKVRVTAPIGAFNGLLQLNPNADTEGHAVEILSSGNDLPAVWPVDFAEVENPEVMEMRESGLAKVTGVTISGEGEFSNSGNFTLTDGEGRTFTLRVDSRSDFGGNTIPTGPVNISGVIGQFDNSAPFTSGYQILAPQFSNVVDPSAIETTPIATIRGMVDDDYAPTDTDTVYVVEGVVTTPINLTSSSHGLFYMQDGESGITVFHRGAGGEVPAQGDKVRVTAPIGAFNGLLQLTPNADTEGHSVEILSSGNDLPAAWPVDFTEVENPEVMEMRESGLAKVNGVTISGEGEFSNSGNFTLTDGEGRTFTLRVDSRSDFGGNAIPTGPVDISGVIGQFDNSAPFTSGYQILAPQFSDVTGGGSETPITTIGSIRALVDDVNYLPVDTDSLYRSQGVVVSDINLTTSSHGLFYMMSEGKGIAVFHRDAGGKVPAKGDLVEVIAPLGHFNGLLEFLPVVGEEGHVVEIISSGNEVPEPIEIDFNKLDDVEYFESIEGSLVVASNVEIQSEDDVFPASGNLILLDDNGNPLDSNGFTLRIDARTDIGGQAVPEGSSTIIGVLAQFDNNDPRTSGYQIIPNSFEQIINDNKAPIVGFDVILLDKKRDSEPANSQFDEYSLLPGETIVIEVHARDFVSGGEITMESEGDLPDSASWAIPVATGTDLAGQFTFTATPDLAGQLVAPVLAVSNDNADNLVQWRIYVPTPAEQNLVITEFLANPTASEEAPHYNPLNRDLEGVEGYEPWTWDEFVELANLGDESINLGGWSIGDANEIRHTFFESFIIDPSSAGVIYGGPLNGTEPQLEGVPTLSASENRFGFGLNNSGGDMIRLYNADGNLIQRVVFSQSDLSDTASVTFTPDAYGLPVAQDQISDLHVSPGFWTNGASFDTHDFVPRVSNFDVSASLVDGQAFQLTWPATPGVLYEVLGTEVLGQPFSVIETDIVFDSDQGEWSTSISGDARYFSVRRK